MADNLNVETPDTTQDQVRTVEKNSIQSPVSVIDVGGSGTEALLGDAGVVMPTFNTAKDGTGTFYAGLVDSDGHLQVDTLSFPFDTEDSAASGNLVTLGGRYDGSPRSLDSGDVGAIALSSAGYVYIINDGTFDVQVSSSTLPTGAATSSQQSTSNSYLSDIRTAVQLIDNAVYADDDDWTDGTSSHLLAGGVYQSSPQSITDGDVGPLQVTENGYAIVSVADTALPSGAATAGNQDLTNTYLVNIRTAVQIIDDWDESNRAKVNIVAGQAGITAGAGAVGASTPRVTLASDDPAVAVLGTIDSDTGNIATATTALNTGATPFTDIDLDETAVQVKGSAATLYSFVALNFSTAVRYIQVFNLPSASVTVGSTTPDLVLKVPTTGDSNGAGFTIPIPSQGFVFSSGLTLACTTTATGSDAPGAGDCAVVLAYK